MLAIAFWALLGLAAFLLLNAAWLSLYVRLVADPAVRCGREADAAVYAIDSRPGSLRERAAWQEPALADR